MQLSLVYNQSLNITTKMLYKECTFYPRDAWISIKKKLPGLLDLLEKKLNILLSDYQERLSLFRQIYILLIRQLSLPIYSMNGPRAKINFLLHTILIQTLLIFQLLKMKQKLFLNFLMHLSKEWVLEWVLEQVIHKF